MRKAVWIACLVILGGLTYVTINGLETEMEHLEAGAGVGEENEEVFNSLFSSSIDDSEWEFENGETFFVEYRLQRDRVRAQEVELLEELIANAQASENSRDEAEEKLLSLVDKMEDELIIENMLKAQGYDDALFFYRNDLATVMLKTESLNDLELAQAADIVASVTGVSRESVQILMQQ